MEPGGVVVAVAACGICGSDLHAFRHGSYVAPGQVMGHEFAGEIVDLGREVDGLAPGDRVVCSPLVACGVCDMCRSGHPHLCPDGTAASIGYGLAGAFAERVVIPRAALGETVHLVPHDRRLEEAALIEPLAVAVHAARFLEGRDVERAVVVGLGPIGLEVVQVLRHLGIPRIIGVDISPLRTAAASSLGATEVLDGGESLHRRLADERGAIDAVFECSGLPAFVGDALRVLRPGGLLVPVAIYGQRSEINASLVVQREIQIQGSFASTTRDFRDAVSLWASGAVDHRSMITHRFPLEEIGSGFREQAEATRAIKVLITP